MDHFSEAWASANRQLDGHEGDDIRSMVSTIVYLLTFNSLNFDNCHRLLLLNIVTLINLHL